MDGFLRWHQSTLRTPPIVAGEPLDDGVYRLAADEPSAGTAVPLLAGGHVYQRLPAHRYAPLDLDAETFELTIQVAGEESYHRLRRLRALAQHQPVPIWLDDPREDVWLVPPEPRRRWTLSRWLPYPTVPLATHPPRVWLRDDASGFDAEELTITTPGPPTDGTVGVDPLDPEAITTADLTAHAGRLLVLRYHPLRRCVVDSVTRAVETPNGLEFTVILREHVPARAYDDLGV